MHMKYICRCGGNPNNYLTEDECLTTCTEDTGSETTVRPQGEAKDPQEVRVRQYRTRFPLCPCPGVRDAAGGGLLHQAGHPLLLQPQGRGLRLLRLVWLQGDLLLAA